MLGMNICLYNWQPQIHVLLLPVYHVYIKQTKQVFSNLADMVCLSVGLYSSENLNKYLQLHSALK